MLLMMKNASYFTLKACFVLKIFKFFVSLFWPFTKNGLIRNIVFRSKWFGNTIIIFVME